MRFIIIIGLLYLSSCMGCKNDSPVGGQNLRVPAEERELISRLLEIQPRGVLELASVTIEGDHYRVAMDLSRKKAVVLQVEENANAGTISVRANGCFARKDGEWQRDSREQFEMQGGVWMLERFLKVLEVAQNENKFTRVTLQPN